MRKAKNLLILALGIIMLWGNVLSVQASSFKFNAIAEKEEVNAGDIVKVDMQVSEIDAGEGINVVEANLEYDETVFESVKFENANQWNTTYNQEIGERKGKFVTAKLIEGVTKEEKIGQIQLKLKDNLEEMETEIKINKITSNNGTELMDEGNRIIKIKIVKKVDEDKKDDLIKGEDNKKDDQTQGKDNKKDDQVGGENPIEIVYVPENKTETEEAKESVLSGNVKTGDIIALVVIVGIVIVGINLVYFMVKGKELKEQGEGTYKKRIIIAIILSIVLMGIIIFLAKDVVASEQSTEEIIKTLEKENEDNPESKAYLVTDKTISRIKPESTIEVLQGKLAGVTISTKENVPITNKTEKVKTGMKATNIQNGRSYEISVLGDINGDGTLNQIELTRDIREHVRSKNWRIERDIEKLSADVTCDGRINEKDVNSIIDYIVFGKLEVAEVEPVKAPKVEITEGNEIADRRYNSKVKVKITQENEEAKTAKTIYKITGSRKTGEITVNKEQEITLSEVGVYKITSYSYGLLGNKSKGTSKIIVIEEKIGQPTITIAPLTWTNGNVIATIRGKEGYNLEYKIDNGAWKKYTEEVEIQENCKITARMGKGINYGENVEKEITNIDKKIPEGKIEVTGKGVNRIALNIEGQDATLSGIKAIRVYQKEETEENYRCIKTFNYAEETTKNNDRKKEQLIVNNLKKATTYNMYIEVEDIAGNKTNKDDVTGDKNSKLEVTETTTETAQPVITATPVEWTNGNVMATIEGETGYKTEYKINDGEWKDYTQTIKIEENCTIAARLTEIGNEENIGKEVTKQITNIDKINPTGSIVATKITTKDIQVKVKGQDATLSGIRNIQVYVKQGTGKYECVKTYEYLEDGTEHALKEEIYKLENLKANTEYKMYVKVEDRAGNIYMPKDVDGTTTEESKIIVKTSEIGTPQIAIQPTTWTNGNVTATITKPVGYNVEGVNIKYVVSKLEITKASKVEWLDYTGNIQIAENTNIYAKMTDGTNEGEIVKKEVTNIDKVAPTGKIREGLIKAEQINVNVEAQDATLSGIREIKVYVKEENAQNYECKKAYTYEQDGTQNNKKVENVLIEGLKAETKYKIYVEVKDVAGNITRPSNIQEGTNGLPEDKPGVDQGEEDPIITVTTLKEAKPEIVTVPTEWTNGNVTATMTRPEGYAEQGYTIEYIVSKEEVTDTTEGWTQYDDTNKVTIEENTNVYARLAKGEIKEKIAKKEVTNIDKVIPAGKIEKDGVKAEEISVNVKGQDATLSGIKEIKVYAKEENAQNYECKETYTYEADGTQNDPKVEKTVIKDLKAETTYKIYVEVKDIAGNRTRPSSIQDGSNGLPEDKPDENQGDKPEEDTIITVTTLKEAIPQIVTEPTEWTNGNVTATMTQPEGYAEQGYTIEYIVSKDEVTEETEGWTQYDVANKVTIEENTNVYARLTQGESKEKIVKKEVTNIDKEVPTGRIVNINAGARTAEVKVEGQDATLSGIKEIRVLIGNEEQPRHTFTYDAQKDYELKKESYTITELTPSTTYRVYIEVEDYAGNIHSTKDNQTEITTQESGTPQIVTEPTEWTNGNVTATIIAPEEYVEQGYTIEYLVSKEEVTGETEGWTQYDDTNRVTVEENTNVYARLTKGETKEKIIKKEVTNIDKVNPTGKIEKDVVKAEQISVNVEGQDATLSGIKEMKVYAKEENAQNYECKETYTYEADGTQNDPKVEKTVIKDLKAETTYKIYVEVKDIAGNRTRPSSIQDGTNGLPEDKPDVDPEEEDPIITVMTLKEIVPEIVTNPTEWTNGNVTATITIPEGYAEQGYTIEYIVSKGEVTDETEGWTQYDVANKVIIEENTNVYARLTKGETKEKIVRKEVTNIDKVNPTGKIEKDVVKAEQISVNVEGQDATLSGIKEIKVYAKEENAQNYECKETYTYEADGTQNDPKVEKTVIKNLKAETTYKIYVEVKDVAENRTRPSSIQDGSNGLPEDKPDVDPEEEDSIITVTTLKEIVPEIVTNPTEWTNGNVTATITIPEGYAEQGYTIEYIVSEDEVTDETEGWIQYDNANKVMIEKNKTIYARLTKGEIKEKIVKKEVTNIDKENPTGSITKVEAGTTTVKMNIEGQDNKLSGIKAIRVYLGENEEPQHTFTYDAKEDYALKQQEVTIKGLTPNTTYKAYIEVEDYAGNVYSTKDNQVEITTQESRLVARIVKIGDQEIGEEDYSSYEYESLREAIEACNIAGETYTIAMIRDTIETNEISSDKSIILDLKGNTITSDSAEKATITNSGTLTVIDSGKESTIYGKIENTAGIGIENIGTLTLGENEEDAPSIDTPRIEGTTFGIKTTEGTLNFYDGKVIGTKAIEGAVADTENLNEDKKYIVVTLNLEDGKKEAYLSTPVAYPVRIDNIHYSSLEEAVTVSKENDTITMLRGIELSEVQEIPEDKNIKLDLNGYTLTSNATDYVLKNNGTFEIMDSSEAKTGVITSSTANIIYNEENANLIISSGTLEVIGTGTSSNYKKILDNEGRFTLKENGKINLTNRYVYGIYNSKMGTAQINGGNIISSVSSTCAIYNNSTNIVNITDGTISGSEIQNENVGEIRIEGGTTGGISNNSIGMVTVEGGTTGGISNNSTGIVTVEGGTIGRISNYRGTVNVAGGTIIDNSYGINNNEGTVMVTGGTITGGSYGINAVGSGTINVTGGTITGGSYGIYSQGTEITLGEKDKNVDTTNPNITGNVYGIYDQRGTGIINFYDGIVKGKEDAIYGTISDIEDDTSIIDASTETLIGITLKKPEENVAQIGETYYKTLQEAIDSCPKGDGNETTQITLLKNVIDGNLEVYEDQNITINLNGKTIKSYAKENLITNNGTLTITDTTETVGNITSPMSTLITNNGILEIIEGNIIAKRRMILNRDEGCGINNSNTGTVTVKGGTITGYNCGIYSEGTVTVEGGIVTETGESASSYGIYNFSGTINVIGGTITTGGKRATAIYNEGTGTINVTGGTIKATKSDNIGIYNNSEGTVKVIEGTIEGSINNNSTGTVTVTGGTTYIINNNSTGTVRVEGGTTDDIRNYSTGTVTVTGGTIKSVDNNSEGTVTVEGGIIGTTTRTYGIENRNTGTINVAGGSITGYYYGINNSGTGTVTVTGGNIIATGENALVANCGIGVYNSSTGTIIIGEKGGDVSTTRPDIKGTTYGVKMGNGSGIFKFYDGIIKGKTNAISSIPNEIEEKHELITEVDTELGLEKVYLSKEKPIAKINDEKYTTISELQKAINELQEIKEKTRIEILRDVSILDDVDSLTIPTNKNIEIDLKGYRILTGKQGLITNNGTLSITDSAEIPGSIIASVTKPIINFGTMTIDKITIETSIGMTIENNKTLEIIGGTITAEESSGSGIYNNSTGTVTVRGGIITSNYIGIISYGTVSVEGGTITSKVMGIHNNSTGTVTVTGGNITDIANSGTEAAIIKGGTITGLIHNDSIGTITVEGGTIGGIRNNNEGTVTVIEGTIKGNYENGIYNNRGTINVMGGSIRSNKYGISNNSGTINVTEGSIRGDENGIYMNATSTGTVKVEGGTITGGHYGIWSEGTGTINVMGGTITTTGNDSIGIYVYRGTITIGKKDGNIDVANPDITGKKYGIQTRSQQGKLNFYDGTIKGEEDAICGTISEIEDGASIIDVSAETLIGITLRNTEDNVAQIGEIYYKTLQEAIDSCPKGDGNETIQITLLKNIIDDNLEVYEDQNITINLNGKTIKVYKDGGLITNNGTLNITDTTETVGSIMSNVTKFIINNGTLSIDKITVQTPTEMAIENNGTLEVEGGIITATGSYGSYGSRSVINNNTGTVTVTGGIITGGYYGITNSGAGTVTVTGGSITGSSCGIDSSGTGTINVTGGTITGMTGINSSGTVIVKGGTITAMGGYGSGIYNHNGEVKVEEGIIISNNYGIYNYRTGAVKVEGGTITGNNLGICNDSTGTVTIGQKGGSTSTTMPEIKGDTYGIDNTGVFNFYDGIIKGKTAWKNGNITDLEPNYEVAIATEDGYQCATLTLSTQTNMVAIVNGTYYNTLQSAIDACIENDQVVLINGVDITEALQVGANKNIVLDLAGFTINSTSPDYAIINNGTLRIMDSSEQKTGSIINQNGSAIQDNGTLTIDEGINIVNGS